MADSDYKRTKGEELAYVQGERDSYAELISFFNQKYRFAHNVFNKLKKELKAGENQKDCKHNLVWVECPITDAGTRSCFECEYCGLIVHSKPNCSLADKKETVQDDSGNAFSSNLPDYKTNEPCVCGHDEKDCTAGIPIVPEDSPIPPTETYVRDAEGNASLSQQNDEAKSNPEAKCVMCGQPRNTHKPMPEKECFSFKTFDDNGNPVWERKVFEGWLYPIPYFEDGGNVLSNSKLNKIQQNSEHFPSRENAPRLEYLLEEFEGKRVRLTVEVLEE